MRNLPQPSLAPRFRSRIGHCAVAVGRPNTARDRADADSRCVDDRVSIGLAAFLFPDLIARACAEFPGRVFGSLDVREGRLAIKGWVETSPLPVAKAAERFREAGVAAAIVTTSRAMTRRPESTKLRMAEIARSSRLPVIASGGVSTLDDIRRLAARFDDGVVGVVVGRALYEGNFSLREAIAAARK
jgi:phosphoribosylformimino-5-aminoimidazole carboxamide ribotide isomerase